MNKTIMSLQEALTFMEFHVNVLKRALEVAKEVELNENTQTNEEYVFNGTVNIAAVDLRESYERFRVFNVTYIDTICEARVELENTNTRIRQVEIGREGLFDYTLIPKLKKNELAKLNTMNKP